MRVLHVLNACHHCHLHCIWPFVSDTALARFVVVAGAVSGWEWGVRWIYIWWPQRNWRAVQHKMLQKDVSNVNCISGIVSGPQPMPHIVNIQWCCVIVDKLHWITPNCHFTFCVSKCPLKWIDSPQRWINVISEIWEELKHIYLHVGLHISTTALVMLGDYVKWAYMQPNPIGLHIWLQHSSERKVEFHDIRRQFWMPSYF